MNAYPVVPMSTDTLLTTTRNVRRRLDLTRPVPVELVRECIEIATQAPTSSNRQHWHFVIIDDSEKRRRLGELYRKWWDWIDGSAYAVGSRFADDPVRSAEQHKVRDSAAFLAEHLAEVPVLVIPCIEVEGDGKLPVGNQADTWGSIMPAAWSYMLAAHSRGLGVAWTSLSVFSEAEIRDLLGIPEHVHQAALMPTAYYTGTSFRRAARIPVDDVLHVNQW